MRREAQVKATQLNTELAQTRKILTADELAHLVAPRARLEVSYDQFSAHFFTIDGVLNGKKVSGAMFAGECMLVFALGPASAQELANQGLRETVKLLHEEFETRDTRLGPLGEGTQGDHGGRRGRGSAPGEELRAFPKLKAMIAHIMGGQTWKW